MVWAPLRGNSGGMNQTTLQKPPSSTRSRVLLGKYGEDQAAAYLERAGLAIIDRNWRHSRSGEIDLIALDGDIVVFVEVKTRRGIGAGLASEAVTNTKLDRIRFLGATWAGEHKQFVDYRFDVVGVYVREDREPIFEWLQDVGQ